ncbi:MAG: hypothetical protein ABWY78_06320 [Microvirga sp.]
MNWFTPFGTRPSPRELEAQAKRIRQRMIDEMAAREERAFLGTLSEEDKARLLSRKSPPKPTRRYVLEEE